MAGEPGRPEKPIDWDVLDELLQAGSDGVQCAAHFHMSATSLYDKVKKKYNMGFSDYLCSQHSNGDALLLKEQFKKALNNKSKGNTQMLMWLGQIRLKQKPPESTVIYTDAPNQDLIDKEHEIMRLKAENEKLKGLTNGNQPEAGQELSGSDSSL